jgi:magnesium-transporting ATPase (P-type)
MGMSSTEEREVRPMDRRKLRLRAALVILAAAFAAFVLSVVLWFTGSENQGIFVGIWVPSILAFGAVALQIEGGGRG